MNLIDLFLVSGLRATADSNRRWPCESSHSITVALDRVEPLTVSLPHPILPNSIKTSLQRKEGIVQVVATKALPNDLWPEDVVDERFRWNADLLQPWTDSNSLLWHVDSQLRVDYRYSPEVRRLFTDPLTYVRAFIRQIFLTAQTGLSSFRLGLQKQGRTSVEFIIQIHLPIRISPRGTPILILTVLDHRLYIQIQTKNKLSKNRALEEYCRVFNLKETSTEFTFPGVGEIDLFRSILRLNSVKIKPTSWQKKNLPLSEPTPWLATFLRPLYRYGFIKNECLHCENCNEDISNTPKRCGRCKAVMYCSVKCQRANWPKNKQACCDV